MEIWYGDADGYIEYGTARGYDVGTLSPSPDERVNQILLVGSIYIDGKFRSGFNGKKVGGRSQEREWPRDGATDADGNEIDITEIPIEVVNATYEAAYREQVSPGSLMPDYVASGRVVSEQVGSLAVTYAQTPVMQASDSWPVIGVIDQILAPLLSGSANRSSLFGQTIRI
jgi:hypothetical protein